MAQQLHKPKIRVTIQFVYRSVKEDPAVVSHTHHISMIY